MKILMIAIMILVVMAVSLCGCCSCCKTNLAYKEYQSPTNTPTNQSSTHVQNEDWTEIRDLSKTLEPDTMVSDNVQVTELPLTIKIDVSSDSPISILITDDDNFWTYLQQVNDSNSITVDCLMVKTDVTKGTFEYKFNKTGSYWVIVDNTGKVEGATAARNATVYEVISGAVI